MASNSYLHDLVVKNCRANGKSWRDVIMKKVSLPGNKEFNYEF